DLGDLQSSTTRDRADITLELGRELLRHRDILSVRAKPTQEVSTDPAADPSCLHVFGLPAAHRARTLRNYLAVGKHFERERTLRARCVCAVLRNHALRRAPIARYGAATSAL